MSNNEINNNVYENKLPPQIINQKSSKTIEIIIEKFNKPFNYFIVVQLDGNDEKRRTRVSDVTSTPSFEDNKFYLPLQEYD